MNSLLTPDSIVKAYVGYTVSFLNKDFNTESNATVFLYMDDNLIDTLKSVGNGIYTSEVYPKVNKKYSLVAFHGNDTISANTVVPDKLIPISPQYKYPTYYDSKDEQEFGLLSFTINDPAEIENYYEVIIFTKVGKETFDYKYYSNSTYIKIADNVIINEGDWDYEPTSLFFSDKLFNGQKYTVNLTMTPGNIEVHTTAGVTVTNTEMESKGHVILRGVSKEYYLFRKYYTRHIFNSQIHSNGINEILFTGDPIDMYTNVNNGLGVIASFNSQLNKIKKDVN